MPLQVRRVAIVETRLDAFRNSLRNCHIKDEFPRHFDFKNNSPRVLVCPRSTAKHIRMQKLLNWRAGTKAL